MMDHTLAKQVFLDIQARPYTLSLTPQDISNNCYYKGIELLQRLGVLGYAVRGRVGETYWDPKIIPEDIYALWPGNLLITHFFVEVLVDDEWRIVDPSFQPELAQYGFSIGGWERGAGTCFPITKLYSQAESQAYQTAWFSQAYQQDFFERGGAFWRALNDWFLTLK